MRFHIGLFAVMVATAAHGETLNDADKAALAGEWRAACGAEASDTSLVLEFALTGGTVQLDDGTEDGGTFSVAALQKQGRLVLAGHTVKWGGQDFRRCRAPVSRAAIRLSNAELAQFSSGMPPDDAVFVDTRARGGCKALDYQYLTIDLVGPLGFQLGRWNSFHLGEAIAGGKKPPFDDNANFTIEKAESRPDGIKLTITERIPPNGSRGDTATITLTTVAGKLSIPEWKRTYLRCPEAALAAH
jgi:hypothetical protein